MSRDVGCEALKVLGSGTWTRRLRLLAFRVFGSEALTLRLELETRIRGASRSKTCSLGLWALELGLTSLRVLGLQNDKFEGSEA